MKFILVLISLLSAFSINAQSYPTLPDSIDLIEAGDEISIFKGELVFGKSHTRLYFSGDKIDELIPVLESGESFAVIAENGRMTIDYLQYKEWYVVFGQRKFLAEIKLIQVDWPGNEINWRMIPRVYFTEIIE